MPKMRPNQIACVNEGMSNPGTKKAAIKIIAPFITKENNPRVIRVIGIEINEITGFIVRLMNPKTMAVTIAQITPSIESVTTPICVNQLVKKTAIEAKDNLLMIRFFYKFLPARPQSLYEHVFYQNLLQNS